MAKNHETAKDEITCEEIIASATKATEQINKEELETAGVAGEASTETCRKVVLRIKNMSEWTEVGEVVINVAMLLQRGGTSPKALSSLKSTWGTSTVTLEHIKNAVVKTDSCKAKLCPIQKYKIYIYI